jgi:hypothetical protein
MMLLLLLGALVAGDCTCWYIASCGKLGEQLAAPSGTPLSPLVAAALVGEPALKVTGAEDETAGMGDVATFPALKFGWFISVYTRPPEEVCSGFRPSTK